MDLLVVGSGLYGLTIAERAASSGLNVTVIEKRSHIGGNACSEIDHNTGIEIHKYGSHIFHTSNPKIWEYVNQFTSFTAYEHRVFTNHSGTVFPMPINLGTINQYFQSSFGPEEARAIIKDFAEEGHVDTASNFEEKAIASIGRPLYEAFIRGYTQKQWQTDPRELSPEIINRLPVRYTYDSRYFSDKWQGLPVDGYSKWLERLADHPRISIELETDFFDKAQKLNKWDTVDQLEIIYTGPVDQFFDYQHGQLGWRTLDFETEVLEIQDYQGTSVINFADVEVPYTRIHEFKHFHPERKQVFDSENTVITREYSRFAGSKDEPYYPINTAEDRSKLTDYRNMAKPLKLVHFGGRLGSYQYLDMHMAIGSALSFWSTKEVSKLRNKK